MEYLVMAVLIILSGILFSYGIKYFKEDIKEVIITKRKYVNPLKEDEVIFITEEDFQLKLRFDRILRCSGITSKSEVELAKLFTLKFPIELEEQRIMFGEKKYYTFMDILNYLLNKKDIEYYLGLNAFDFIVQIGIAKRKEINNVISRSNL